MLTALCCMQVSYKVHDNLMLLDFNTISALEIIENAKSGLQKKGSLFATQNNCKTAGGARLLRCSLLQPLKNAERPPRRWQTLNLVHGLDLDIVCFFSIKKVI